MRHCWIYIILWGHIIPTIPGSNIRCYHFTVSHIDTHARYEQENCILATLLTIGITGGILTYNTLSDMHDQRHHNMTPQASLNKIALAIALSPLIAHTLYGILCDATETKKHVATVEYIPHHISSMHYRNYAYWRYTYAISYQKNTQSLPRFVRDDINHHIANTFRYHHGELPAKETVDYHTISRIPLLERVLQEVGIE